MMKIRRGKFFKVNIIYIKIERVIGLLLKETSVTVVV